MYLRHFAFTRMPFETPAETDELFESNARREAEARLHHLIELRGIGLLTGEVGSGKTTVCRHLTAQLHPGLLLFLRLVDDGFPGLFETKGARISHVDSSLPEGSESRGVSDARRRVKPHRGSGRKRSCRP